MRYTCLYAAVLTGCHGELPSTPGQPLQVTSAVYAPVEPPSPESNEAPRDGERVVAKLKPKFRDCYQRGLIEENHAMSGVVVLHLRVAPDGTVRTVDIAKRAGLSNDVAGCLSRQAQRAIFEATGPGGATLDVPIHFVNSNVAAH